MDYSVIMAAENEDIQVNSQIRNGLNIRQPTLLDEGELVVDSVSSLPGRIEWRSGQIEQERSGGQAVRERSGGQAEQHQWALASSTFDDDVIYSVTCAVRAPEPAMVLDDVRSRRRRFPPGDVDRTLGANPEATDNSRTGRPDGFLSTSGSRELQNVEEENRSLRYSLHCKICIENPIDAVFVPCGHRFSCLACSQRCLQEQERQGQRCLCSVCRCPADIVSVKTP